MHRGELYRSITRAVVYSRVSTDVQERDGTSLDTQERACVEYAQAKGWVVAETIKNTASGSNMDRPGIERVRQLLNQGFVDVVLAYAGDRLSGKRWTPLSGSIEPERTENVASHRPTMASRWG